MDLRKVRYSEEGIAIGGGRYPERGPKSPFPDLLGFVNLDAIAFVTWSYESERLLRLVTAAGAIYIDVEEARRLFPAVDEDERGVEAARAKNAGPK